MVLKKVQKIFAVQLPKGLDTTTKYVPKHSDYFSLCLCVATQFDYQPSMDDTLPVILQGPPSTIRNSKAQWMRGCYFFITVVCLLVCSKVLID